MGGAGGAGPSRADEADSDSTATVPAGSALSVCVRAASKCAVHSSVAWASPPSGMALYWGGVQVGVRAPCAVRALINLICGPLVAFCAAVFFCRKTELQETQLYY